MVEGVLAEMDRLRGRFARLKGGRPMAVIAPEIGLTIDLLLRFRRGKNVRIPHIRQIEEWCDRQEDYHRAS